MTAAIKAVVAVLVVGVVVAGGLFVRSTGRAADLEAQVKALESERADLQAKLSATQKDAAERQARLSQFENKQAAATRINQELVVAAGSTQSYVFSPTVIPGTLS